MTPSDGKAWLAAIIDVVMRRVDYHAHYACRVVAQREDGTLDVVPDTATIPAMTEVPIRYGLPGVSAKIKPGARVLVGFDGGDASRPIATVWESAAVEEIRIISDTRIAVFAPDLQLGEADGAPLARVGDPVDVVFDVVALNAAVLSGTGILQAVGVISAGAVNTRAT